VTENAGVTAESEAAARGEAARAARASYGRLLAILARSTGDLELAEDCLGDAFTRALESWPRTGVPRNPEAWLLTAARNGITDVRRSAAYRNAVALEGAPRDVVATIDALDPDAIPDERLALLFVCAHPAIEPTVRTPLMLQTVLGFEAAPIARAFAVRPAAMAQRLVRAKRRIRDARIRFVVPERSRLGERLPPVLEAIYGAYAIDWQITGGRTIHESLVFEAHYLAPTLAQLLPDEPEVLGLAALISLSLARHAARGGAEEYVPLDEQDARQWDRLLSAPGARAGSDRQVSTGSGDPVGALLGRERLARIAAIVRGAH
jgi:RNA polymerase sigma-70 factor (ECF subfamily)